MTVFKNNLVLIGFSTVLIGQPVGAIESPLSSSLQSCAVAALAVQKLIAKSVLINDTGLKKSEIDRNPSHKYDEYQIHIANNTSGEELGIATCELDSNGEVIKSSFDT